MPKNKFALIISVSAIALSSSPVWAQQITLNDVLVTSRLGADEGAMMPTIITAEEIKRNPGRNLTQVLSREMGIQIGNQSFSSNGYVDMRGFGAAASSNVLILVNGRRLNDLDLTSVDLDSIAVSSLDRIEILRGNSGAVLYGDGAVGGTINLITKSAINLKDGGTANLGFGSFGTIEGDASITKRFGSTSLSAFGRASHTDGYRQNNEARSQNASAELRHNLDSGEVYANVTADKFFNGLPAARPYELHSNKPTLDPKGTSSPYDWGKREGVNVTLGGLWRASGNATLLADATWRHKDQQTMFYWLGGGSYADTSLNSFSVNPRVQLEHNFGKAILGVDLSTTSYTSDRSQFASDKPLNVYDLDQNVAGIYAQNTAQIAKDLSLTTGARLQWHDLKARDTFDSTAPGWGVAGSDLDQSETDWAANLGLEYALTPQAAIFARTARAFRLPNVDERVGAAYPTNFDLKTQTSWDVEMGTKLGFGPVAVQGSVWVMELDNEIHYLPSTFSNINLDPTRRYGAEAQIMWDVSDKLRLRSSLTHTIAKFREGDNKGNEVPLVSRWTGMVGLSADVWHDYLTLDVDARYVGDRRFDNDQVNFQPKIDAHTLVDLKLGGAVSAVNWSVSVHNLFDAEYIDYGIANTTTYDVGNGYPMPGRTYMGRVGVTF